MNHLSKINKHNYLVEANYRISLLGQRVFLLALSKINPLEPLHSSYTITASEYAQTFQIDNKTAYRDLQKGLDELYDADIKMRNLQLKILTRRRIISEGEYHEGEGKISLSFPEKLKPFLCDLKQNYTSYRIGQVVKLKSNYSIRLFEMLIQYKNLGTRKLSLEMLRECFKVGDKYKVYHAFFKRVIRPAIDELNAKTSFTITYQFIKKNRSIEAIEFSFIDDKNTTRLEGENFRLNNRKIEI